MANILISHFSTIRENNRYVPICFFEGLAQAFSECGHNVKELISTAFLPSSWNGFNETYSYIDKDKLKTEIENFKPSLCIFANNSVPDIVYEATDCPIILLFSDSLNYFNDKEKLLQKKYLDRIFFYAPFQRDVDDLIKFYGTTPHRVIRALPATGIKHQNITVDKNITFIGSTFENPRTLPELIASFSDKQHLKDILNRANKSPTSLHTFLTDAEKMKIECYMPVDDLGFIFSSRDRLLTLALLAEYDLYLYGPKDWLKVAQYFPDVAASYHPDKIYSLGHNQNLYNSSKICLSVSHAQAADGFPWRVMDIMASNGCLLSDRKQGIENFTKGFVSIPMFDSPLEAREIAQKLLKDTSWRNDIVLGSQACIDAKGRWHHRFNELENIINIKLTHEFSPNGKITYLHGEDYINTKNYVYGLCTHTASEVLTSLSRTCLLTLIKSIPTPLKNQLKQNPYIMRFLRQLIIRRIL